MKQGTAARRSPDVFGVAQALAAAGFTVTDEAEFAARPASCLPVPAVLHRKVCALVRRLAPAGLYAHQVRAIEAVLAGDDVCLSTSTASGKSLVFIAAAAHMLLADPAARILALYPAKALIQDQREKWQALLGPLRLTTAFIDGSIRPPAARLPILASSRVVLMTPDVAHAWLLGSLARPQVRSFLASLRLLVLDEAHVYEGVFGTNMAYLLRRLETAAGRYRVVCSTATLGEPEDFGRRLTGRDMRSFGPADDGSAVPQKRVVLVRPPSGKSFDATVALLTGLAKGRRGPFLAFGDSRKTVELIVAAVHRGSTAPADDEDEAPADDAGGGDSPAATAGRAAAARPGRPAAADELPDGGILPFRAGYEHEDRLRIQKALAKGRLAGVVATSALELGLDIGEIDLVVLLDQPPTMKAFWQRTGRAGRRIPGTCVLVDVGGGVSQGPHPLETYLRRPIEPSWLYLDNRYIQYANALCAAAEAAELGSSTVGSPAFAGLPDAFRSMLDNELDPTGPVAADLYPLKQRGQAGPHHEFPVRSGIEPSFEIRAPGRRLGEVTLAQALREAYPGGIYYYMARPYRVVQFAFGRSRIEVRPERHWTTRPRAEAMVFPAFGGGILELRQGETGFVAEVEVQVSERVLGFTERRGPNKEEHLYGPSSPFYMRPLQRYFETTGVCWCFGEHPTGEAVAELLLSGFADAFGVQPRDLGAGPFLSKQSPSGAGACRGFCVYDATYGSLRLTQRLGPGFAEAARAGARQATAHGCPSITD